MNVLSGYNSTVFIYGMTGAGKTHTMFRSISDENGGQG
jgi:chromosomal replication initiation ATPase DnaA